MSDLHIENYGKTIWNVDTKEHFNQALKKIKSIGNIDAIIVSGDLSNDGSLWSYNFIDESFAHLGIPTYCCPGNHDNLKVFYNDYQPSFYKNIEYFIINGITFIMLNSVIDGMARGFFNPKTLSRLIQSSYSSTIVVLHHPPIEQKGWLNRKLLENRNAFNDMVVHTNNIKLVLYGHTHYHRNDIMDGIVYSSASSIGFAFNPYRHKFEIANGEEGFSLITITDGKINIENILI